MASYDLGALTDLLYDNSIELDDRIETAIALADQNQTDQAAAVLKTFVLDPNVVEEADRRQRQRMLRWNPKIVEPQDSLAAAQGQKPGRRFRSQVLEKSIQALGKLGQSEILKSLLGEDDWRIQLEAAIALGEFGEADEAFDIVIQRLDEAEGYEGTDLDMYDMHEKAIVALGALRDESMVPKLVSILQSVQGEEAAVGLAKLGRTNELLAAVGDVKITPASTPSRCHVTCGYGYS